MKSGLFLTYIILLVSVSVIDFRKYYIPNLLNILIFTAGIIHQGYYQKDLLGAVIGAGVLSLPFILLYGYVGDFLKKDVIGFGDVKLVMGIGSFMGIEVLEKGYIFFLTTFILASIYGIGVIIFRRQGMGTKIPMAPFISMAGIWLCL